MAYIFVKSSEFEVTFLCLSLTFIKGPPESPLHASLLCSVPAQISDSVTLNPHPNVWNVLHSSGFTTGNLNKYYKDRIYKTDPKLEKVII